MDHTHTCSSSFANLLSVGNVVQRSVKRVTLWYVPLDVVCGVGDYFEHVEELECEAIMAPQQVCVYFLCVHYVCTLGSLAANSEEEYR